MDLIIASRVICCFLEGKLLEKGPEKITHVGIYLGNLDFIHSAGIISIDSFDKNKPNYNEYRLKRLYSCKTNIDFS